MDLTDTDVSSGMSALSGLGLNFSFSSLMAAFIFGVVGFYLFRHGKKQTNYTHIFIGIILMVYPMFVDGAWLNWGVGFLLCGAAYYFR